jgi:DNA-binding CsgD family transcriptional regulator
MNPTRYEARHGNPETFQSSNWIVLEQLFSTFFEAGSSNLETVATDIVSLFKWDEVCIEDSSDPALGGQGARAAAPLESSLVIAAPSGAPFSAITFIRSEEEPWTTDEKAAANLASMLLAGLYSAAGPAHAHDIFDIDFLKEQGLTSRETDVFILLAAGSTSQQAAFELDISPRTVEKHSQNIYRNLGVKNLSAAMSSLLRA